MRAKHFLPAVFLLAGCGTDVTGPSASLFSCLLGPSTELTTGEVVHTSGAANRGLCLSGGAEGAEFVYIPFHAADGDRASAVRLEVDLTGAGFVAPTGPPAPAPGGAAWPAMVALDGGSGHTPARAGRDVAFHRSLREQERTTLGRRIRPGAAVASGGSAAWPSPRTAAAVPTVGEESEYNVAISCTQGDFRTGRVEYVSDRAVVVADVANPGGLTPEDYQHFGETFDTLVDPVSVQHFGEPTDIDDNDRVIIFFTRAVNELAAPSEGVFTVGFFWSGDLFPEEDTQRAEACPAANQAEMFYMLTADPNGAVGPVFSVDFIRRAAVPIIAHEYQHLINASRRLWVNNASTFEASWLNEGLSHAAEELMFYAVSGLSPGTNIDIDDLRDTPGAIDAFNIYMGGNFSNYSRYLERPDTASLMGIDALPTRGASWNFLRYAADRSGLGDEGFFMDVVNAQTAGLENLQNSLGIEPLTWMRDWTVSVYADDAVPVSAEYRQLSWNFRNLYPNSSVGEFPLAVRSLANSSQQTLRLQPGGAAFPRFGLEADAVGVIHVEVEGAAPPPSLRGSYLRTK